MQAASCALARQSSGEREETVLKITARKLHRSLVLPTAHPFVGHAETTYCALQSLNLKITMMV